ncbi:MAG: Yellowstone lake phycodnavirus 3 [Verrucomicrobiota bacterium]
MRLLRPAFLLVLALTVLGTAGAAAENRDPVAKKGVGLPERKGKDAGHLRLLKVSWYYNWGDQTKLTSEARFVPMIYSGRRAAPEQAVPFLLGFNEPDHPKQANLSVEDALAKWPALSAQAGFIVSPALAGNPVTKDWLNRFLKAGAKVDAIAVHWYKGADAGRFIKDLEQIRAHFGKPIWVTEFAPQTAADSAATPGKYSQVEVDAFIRATTRFMEKTSWVQRYAWHDSGVGTSALFDANGELTPTGKAYAEAGR